MASSVATFKHEKTGQIREAPVGFSWTTLLFGPLPALCRGDYKWFIIQLILAFLTSGFSILFFMFAYNRLYINELVNNGFHEELPEEC